MEAERSEARVADIGRTANTAYVLQTRRCPTVPTVAVVITVRSGQHHGAEPQRRRETRAAPFYEAKVVFLLVKSLGWQAMLKYSNRF